MTHASVFWAADLHVHSSVSDGTDTPVELMRAASRSGLSAVALTDHDTTGGWDDAASAVTETGVALIRGVELSTRFADGGSIHLLGYLVRPDDHGLVTQMAAIRAERVGRAERIVQHLARDYPIDWAGVVASTAPGATIGRPHIADALVARGLVRDRAEAFATVLHPRAGYVVPHRAPAPIAGVALIRAAGGVPVLAHPASRGAIRSLTDERLAQLVDAGLFGLELDHPENLAERLPHLRERAAYHGLAVTGSSDYHGTGKPNRLGQCRTDADVVERIVAAASSGMAVLLP